MSDLRCIKNHPLIDRPTTKSAITPLGNPNHLLGWNTDQDDAPAQAPPGGTQMVQAPMHRDFFGTSLRLLWDFFGTLLGLLWDFFGTSLELLWNLTYLTYYRDFWQLRHWLLFWQLRTWILDSLCFLTIKSDTGQHLQFLRCFFFFCSYYQKPGECKNTKKEYNVLCSEYFELCPEAWIG